MRGGVAISADKSDREVLNEIYSEVVAMREDMKRLASRIAMLELMLIPDEDDSEEEEEAADIADERDRLIAWARLKEELGL